MVFLFSTEISEPSANMTETGSWEFKNVYFGWMWQNVRLDWYESLGSENFHGC